MLQTSLDSESAVARLHGAEAASEALQAQVKELEAQLQGQEDIKKETAPALISAEDADCTLPFVTLSCSVLHVAAGSISEE